MPPIVAGVDLGRKYTADEVADMHRTGRLRNVTLQGYLWRHDWDGMGSFVHFTDPTANRVGEPGGGLRDFRVPDPLPGMKEAVASESPIVKRTPQERVASMLMMMMSDAKKYGSLGLSEEKMKSIVGESWRSGEPMTEDVVRKVVAHYLGTSESIAKVDQNKTEGRAARKFRREQERLEKKQRESWERKQRELEKNHELTKKYL